MSRGMGAAHRQTWAELRRYPSALAGVALILLLVALALHTLATVPYDQAVASWRSGEARLPINARPVWSDWLSPGRAPRSQSLIATEIDSEAFPGGRRLTQRIALDYAYDDFPSELALFLTPRHSERAAFLRLTWHTPDGREINLGSRRLVGETRVALSQDRALEQRLGRPAHLGLLAAPDGEAVLPGRHTLTLEAVFFDPGAELASELLLYGRVHGLAGTDHQRRDLGLALRWGTPIALAFGLVAAVGTTLSTLVIAAVGVWYRGWVDALIQRLTEVNMILPLLPILVMVGTLYSTSIWLMLGVVVALGIFSAGIKTYRAMLLPIREAPYIEAARAYGASHLRIVMRYMLPRILPVLIPTFVTLIPTFVFLEASLAVLGLGDPVLPTWGKVLNDAQAQSALYNGYYYWVLAPAALLMLSGLGFAMLGFALDRVFNPRLRSL